MTPYMNLEDLQKGFEEVASQMLLTRLTDGLVRGRARARRVRIGVAEALPEGLRVKARDGREVKAQDSIFDLRRDCFHPVPLLVPAVCANRSHAIGGVRARVR
jgi:hypothetical protein